MGLERSMLPHDVSGGSYDLSPTSSVLPSTFLTASPKQTNMADYEERQSLLGDDDEGSFAGRKAPRGPGRPMAAICDPSRIHHRVVVLMFMCFLGFGEQ